MKACDKGMLPFLKAEEIESLVKNLADQIKQRHPAQDIHLICPLKGSVILLADLSRHLDSKKITMDFVKIKSKGEGFIVEKDIETDIKGRHVIIVEEIIDAGRTLSFLKNHLLLSHPRSVEIACLLDKPARRELPITPDYRAKTIDDRYVVGYGLDADEVGRNYPDIYHYLQ